MWNILQEVEYCWKKNEEKNYSKKEWSHPFGW